MWHERIFLPPSLHMGTATHGSCSLSVHGVWPLHVCYGGNQGTRPPYLPHVMRSGAFRVTDARFSPFDSTESGQDPVSCDEGCARAADSPRENRPLLCSHRQSLSDSEGVPLPCVPVRGCRRDSLWGRWGTSGSAGRAGYGRVSQARFTCFRGAARLVNHPDAACVPVRCRSHGATTDRALYASQSSRGQS